jgi:hypothetical protein
MVRANEIKTALRRQKEIPRLANSLAGCVRWRIGDIEDFLLAQIVLMIRRKSSSKLSGH